MLIKKSVKNQIAIPKVILEEIGLGSQDVYFDIGCKNGHIILKPMEVEEKIPVETIRKFEKKYARRSKGDVVFNSWDDAIRFLNKK